MATTSQFHHTWLWLEELQRAPAEADAHTGR